MANQGRVVILCESYPSILYTLYRLEKEDISAVTVFITSLEDLYLLFQDLNAKVFHDKLELVFYPPYVPGWKQATGIKKLLRVPADILGERRHLKWFYQKYFSRLRDAEVLFPSPGYSGAKIYTLRKLAQRNRLVFIDPGPPYMGRYRPRSLRDWATLFMYKMTYGRDVQLGQFPSDDPWSTGFAMLGEGFLKNAVRDVFDWANRNEVMENFAWEKYCVFNTGEFKVIYFHQDFVGRYVPDRETFSRELAAIFNVVLRHFPENEIARKYHPAHADNQDVISVGRELPIYVPAELLYHEKVAIYLGISSTAIANVRGGGQAISLINLITFQPEELKERFRERLKSSSRREIFFPASLEELESMISGIAGTKA